MMITEWGEADLLKPRGQEVNIWILGCGSLYSENEIQIFEVVVGTHKKSDILMALRKVGFIIVRRPTLSIDKIMYDIRSIISGTFCRPKGQTRPIIWIIKFFTYFSPVNS